MTVSEMIQKFAKIDESKIRLLGVEAVQEIEEAVVMDSIDANMSGKTFAGNEINKTPPFSDWFDSGEFHEGLHFADKNDIEFYSTGEGFEAISGAFSKTDTAAPTAKILRPGTISDIQKVFIRKIKKL